MAVRLGVGSVPAGTPAPVGASTKQVKKGYKAPPGYVLVKQANGKYKLVKKKGAAKPNPKAAPKRGAAPVAVVPGDDPTKFVADEIARQIGQDSQLTRFLDQQTAGIANDMTAQSKAAADIAAQYAPVAAYANPTLDANAQATVAQDVALTDAVVGDQAKSLAGLIAAQGSAGTNLMGNMRGAQQIQHRDYARQLEGMRPDLVRRRSEELEAIKMRADEAARAAAAHRMSMQTQAMQNQLAKDQFGLQTQQAKDASDLGWAGLEAGSGGGSGGEDEDSTSVTFGGLRLPAAQIGLVRDGIGSWRTVPDAGRTLNSFMARVTQSSGLSRAMVARLAMNTLSPSELKRYSKSRDAFLKTMQGAGVNAAVRTAWANKVFGGGAGADGGNGKPSETRDQELNRLTGGGAHRPYIGQTGSGSLGTKFKVQGIKVSPNGRFWHWTVLVFPPNGTTKIQRLHLRAGQKPGWLD